jgi:hypothetical protein
MRLVDLAAGALEISLMKMFPAFLRVFILMTAVLSAEDAPKQIEAIHFSKIIPLLPVVPAGWTAPEPDGSTMDAGGFKMTTVGRTYTKGEGDGAPSVSFNVIDYAGNKQFYDATTGAWNFSQETTDGYMKSVKIDGNPGFETYEKGGKTGQLWVVVAGRFFVHVETTNLEPPELQVWMKLIDLKKLATLK